MNTIDEQVSPKHFEIYHRDLSKEKQENLKDSYRSFWSARRARKGAKSKMGEKFMGWKQRSEAQEHASHPVLVELKPDKEALIKVMEQGDAVDSIDEDD